VKTAIRIAFHDSEGNTHGFDSAYMGDASQYIWTSSLFMSYTVKRWAVRISDGYWENCGGFLYVYNRVRCVFPGVDNGLLTKNNLPPQVSPEILVHPNPSAGVFSVRNAEDALVFVYDHKGALCRTNKLESTGRVDLSGFPPGLYLMKFIKDHAVTTRKVIVSGE
jgi:hypothetical protein